MVFSSSVSVYADEVKDGPKPSENGEVLPEAGAGAQTPPTGNWSGIFWPPAPDCPCWRKGKVKRLLLALIRFYRKHISPHTPPSCRYVPTCSQYALEAIEKYGAAKGGWLALKRISRCHPFHRGEHDFYDPVP